ncbi:MAG: RNA methyltransferase, partial [Verrucomicrobiae bacterium]|nr:RNA methyltransferase [Verrucomicrobiae bacterium]
EGRLAVEALLESDFAIDAILTSTEIPDPIAETAAERGIPLISWDRRESESLLGFSFHRGWIGVAQKPRLSFGDWAVGRLLRRLVVLDGLADPGNVGTIIRNAAAFGFEAVICSASGASPFNAKAVRATAQALFRLPVFVETDWLSELRRHTPTISLVGTDVRSGAATLEAFSFDPPESLAVIFGGEADGLSDDLLKACDHRITIPLSSAVESLNVASASAIVLHALRA